LRDLLALRGNFKNCAKAELEFFKIFSIKRISDYDLKSVATLESEEKRNEQTSFRTDREIGALVKTKEKRFGAKRKLVSYPTSSG
jgi:hypothetical protein